MTTGSIHICSQVKQITSLESNQINMVNNLNEIKQDQKEGFLKLENLIYKWIETADNKYASKSTMETLIKIGAFFGSAIILGMASFIWLLIKNNIIGN